MFPLTCVIQNYAWGKVGEDSEVARLVVDGDPLTVIEDGKPYAEVRRVPLVLLFLIDLPDISVSSKEAQHTHPNWDRFLLVICNISNGSCK